MYLLTNSVIVSVHNEFPRTARLKKTDVCPQYLRYDKNDDF